MMTPFRRLTGITTGLVLLTTTTLCGAAAPPVRLGQRATGATTLQSTNEFRWSGVIGSRRIMSGILFNAQEYGCLMTGEW